MGDLKITPEAMAEAMGNSIYLKNIVKPPLGVAPKWIYEEQRILDLARAIYEYVGHEKLKDNQETVKLWAEELSDRIEKYEGPRKGR